MKYNIRIYAVLIAVFTCITVSAQDKRDMFNPVHTALVSQTIAPDARSAGLGDVGAATDPDVNSQFWNIAKYPFTISRAGVSVNYTPWLRQLVNDMYLANVTGYYRIGDYSAVSASLNYFSLGEVFTEYNQDTNEVGGMSIKPYEMSFDVGYSLMLSEKFSLGAGVRLLYSDMSYSQDEEVAASSAFAADIACYYNDYVDIGDRECQLGLGLSLKNIGSKITFNGSDRSEFIPTSLRLGASLMVPVDEYSRFTVAADASKLLVPTYPIWDEEQDAGKYADLEDKADKEYYSVSSISGMFKSFNDAPGGFKEELQEINWSLGAEYIYNDRFTLRAGYHHESENKGNRKYFTVGAGFRMNVFYLDAGYVIATAKSNPLDQTMRFTLGFDMDGLKDLFRRR